MNSIPQYKPFSVEVAKNAGFCFGVRRAVQAVQEQLERGAGRVLTWGPIIHNPEAVAELSARGAQIANTIEETRDAVVIIRSHGVEPRTFQALQAQAAEVIDATCPYVKRIHAIAEEAYRAGKPLILIGERDHPEIIGIAGHAPGAFVVRDVDEVEALPALQAPVVAAQTTLRSEDWDAITEALMRRFPDGDLRRTICSSTQLRQEEAVELAKRSDAMIVLGGKNSSNTRKLYDLSRAQCPRTIWIQTAQELREAGLPAGHISITTGASTPDWILKEVLATMTDMEHQDLPQENLEPEKEASFQEAFEKTLVTIRPGHMVKGTIVQVTEDEVCVNIGYKSDGLIPRSELSSDGDPRLSYHIGDEIEVEVMKVNDGEGNVLLSQTSIANRKNWETLIQKFEAGEVVEGIGKEVVKGGLIANVMGIRTFIPASQLSDRYVEKIEEFVGQPLRLRIIEVDRQKRRLVASRKQVLQEEKANKKAELWNALEENQVVHGIVRRLTDFGAFVDIGGLDGLIHVTDLSWARVRHPSEVIKINTEVDVLVLSLDRDKDRISLGLKQLMPKPWDNAVDKYPVGSIIEGTVVRIQPFGAFVQLEPGLDGLVHISQIAPERVNKVEDRLTVGDIVYVKVLEVNPESKRISLSMREALDELFRSEAMGAAESAQDSEADETETADAPAEEDAQE